MQVIERKTIEMKRDMDLIRDLLLYVENDRKFNGQTEFILDNSREIGMPDRSIEEITYHVVLLVKAGYLEGTADSMWPVISRLTWQGHEFLDNIRDQDVWSKTKERIKGLQSVAISIIAAIAEAEVKKKFGL